MYKNIICILALMLSCHVANAAKQTHLSTDSGGTMRSKLNSNATELYDAVGALESATSNLDNTADADKPVSTAQQAAIDAKSDKTAVIRYWSDWPDASPGNTLSVGTVVAYEGELYKTTQEFVKTAGATPTGFTTYFTKITSADGGYTLPTASAETLGGVKVGSRLTITDGVLSADVQTTDISDKEDSLGNPSVSGYVLSSTTGGVRSWVEMTGGGTGIAHATADGNYYASKDGGWASLTGIFQSPLVSGTNIKTINSTSLLGSGNIDISGDITSVVAGTGLSGGAESGVATLNLADTAVTAGDYTYSSITVDAQGRITAAASGTAPVTTETDPVFSAWGKDYADLTNTPTIPVNLSEMVDDATHRWVTDSQITAWTVKQDALVADIDYLSPATAGTTYVPLSINLPTEAPANGRQIIQAVGGCSDSAYDNQTDCETNSGTWTTPTGVWTSVIAGLINDSGTGVDDLWSADKIATELSTKQDVLGYTPEASANKGVANGYASLGADGLVPTSQLPETTGTDDQTAAEVSATPWGSYEETNVQTLMLEIDTAIRALIPDDLADLSDDATHRLVTDSEKSTWNAKQNMLVADTDYLTPGTAASTYQTDLAVPTQAEAEAGTATSERVWTAQRVAQAIAALAPGSIATSIQMSFVSDAVLEAQMGSKVKVPTGVDFTTADIGCDASDSITFTLQKSATVNGTYSSVGTVSISSSQQNESIDISSWENLSAGDWVRIDLTSAGTTAKDCIVVIGGNEL